jgi:REP element-mobilizing transposase RayT
MYFYFLRVIKNMYLLMPKILVQHKRNVNLSLFTLCYVMDHIYATYILPTPDDLYQSMVTKKTYGDIITHQEHCSHILQDRPTGGQGDFILEVY